MTFKEFKALVKKFGRCSRTRQTQYPYATDYPFRVRSAKGVRSCKDGHGRWRHLWAALSGIGVGNLCGLSFTREAHIC